MAVSAAVRATTRWRCSCRWCARSKKGEPIDHVLIETTGLAKPASLARFFLADSPLKAFYRLDGIVTVVDAYHGTSQLIQFREVKEQVAVADLILLNKTDLAEEPQIHNLEEWLHGLNPTAPIVRASRGSVPLESILNIGGFDLEGKEHILEEHHDHEHAHDADITAISIREERPLNRGKFIKWLTEFVAMDGGDLLRYKGILNFDGLANRSILQGVHMIRELEDAGPWPAGRRARDGTCLHRQAPDGRCYPRGGSQLCRAVVYWRHDLGTHISWWRFHRCRCHVSRAAVRVPCIGTAARA